MRFVARGIGAAVIVAAGIVVCVAQETVSDFQGPAAEQFLTEARITARRGLQTGVTRSLQLTLEHEGRIHRAVFKNIDESKFGVTTFPDGSSEIGFQDSWRTEIAAYRVDRIIGLGMVPATIERRVDGKIGSVQWWVESWMSEGDREQQKVEPPDVEAWDRQAFKSRLFDQLIANVDRNLGNLLITKSFEIRLIDHSRSFRARRGLTHPERLTRFSRSLLDGLKKLERNDLKRQLGEYLNDEQIDRLLVRRDDLLKLAARLVAERGEAAVIYP